MSYNALVVHVGFSTKRRRRTIRQELDEPMRRAVAKVLTWNGSRLIAFGAADDHVHILVSFSPRANIERLVTEIKRALNDLFGSLGVDIKWQDGFWAFTVGPRGVPRVANYVRRQRIHHGSGLGYDSEQRAFARAERRAREAG